MTSGSKTHVTIPVYVPPYGNGNNLYGVTATWTGSDRTVLKRPHEPLYYRDVNIRVRIPSSEAPKPYLGKKLYKPPKAKYNVYVQTLHLPVYAKRVVRNPAKTPGWFEDHPFSKTWKTYNRGQGTTSRWTFYANAPGPRYVYEGESNCPGSALAPPVEALNQTWLATDDYKLIEKLGVKLRGSEFNLASFLGAEGKDTVKFIADTAQTVAKSLFYARKGKVGSAIRVLVNQQKDYPPRKIKAREDKIYSVFSNERSRRDEQLTVYRQLASRARSEANTPAQFLREPWRQVAANDWLEYHLAIEPLLGDVKAAAEMLAHKLEVEPKLEFKVSRRVNVPGASMRKPSSTLGAYLFDFNEYSKRGQLIARLSEHPSTAQLSGLMDPEVVLWNALPLTFVSDYFLPIGDWLSARALASKLEGVFVKSVKVWRQFGHSGQYPFERVGPGINGTLPIRKGGTTQPNMLCSEGTFTRTVTTNLVDQVEFPKVKPLGGFSSWQRMTTMVSLVTSYSTGGLATRHTR